MQRNWRRVKRHLPELRVSKSGILCKNDPVLTYPCTKANNSVIIMIINRQKTLPSDSSMIHTSLKMEHVISCYYFAQTQHWTDSESDRNTIYLQSTQQFLIVFHKQLHICNNDVLLIYYLRRCITAINVSL